MSSLSSSVILSAISVMEKQLALLRAQLGEASVAAPAKAVPAKAVPAKEKKAAKKEEKKPRAPTAWLLFTERVRGLLREADYPPKALGPEMTKFCSELKKDNGDLASWASEDILARRAAWSAPESKLPSAPASVVSEAAEAAEAKPVKKARKSAKKPVASEDEAAPASDGEASSEKKKRVWSPEAKARAAARAAAKKASAAAPAPEDEAAPASDAEESVASSQKKRGPKKFSEMSAEEVAAAKAKRASNKAKKEEKAAPSSPALPPLPPSPPSEAEGAGEFTPVMLSSKRYLVNLSNGHAYYREADGTQGDWAGIFKKTGNPDPKKSNGAWIDDSKAEPLSFTDLEALD